ncbi:MAG: hypothetical protein H8E31_06980, partial [Planctomycetes bacterium]|nr:hypothetical protein [Planctomycetota bacterium]
MILAALLTALASPAPQAPPGVDFELQQRIDHAIDQGTDALLRSQELDGSWRKNLERYPAGMTSLAVYTLLKCGLPPRHPAIARAVAFLRGHEG